MAWLVIVIFALHAFSDVAEPKMRSDASKRVIYLR
jgi:hypothetical protein